MNVTCPNCGTAFPITAGVNDADARRFAALMGELPPAIGKRIPAYLALFKPQKQGLRWSRMVSLLEELMPQIQTGRAVRDRTSYPASVQAWAEAMEAAIHHPPARLPLKSHGYLLEIVITKGSEIDSKAEREREQQLRQGQRPGLQPVNQLIDPDAAQAAFERNMRRLGVLPKGEGDEY